MNNLAVVQTAIYTLLATAPATYPVYDAVPQGVAKPYIVIGEWTGLPDEELSAVTTDATIALHTWSIVASKSESHTILQFIRARLDNIAVGGSWAFSEDMVEIMEDPASTSASRLYHGVARYRVRVG